MRNLPISHITPTAHALAHEIQFSKLTANPGCSRLRIGPISLHEMSIDFSRQRLKMGKGPDFKLFTKRVKTKNCHFISA